MTSENSFQYQQDTSYLSTLSYFTTIVIYRWWRHKTILNRQDLQRSISDIDHVMVFDNWLITAFKVTYLVRL